MDESRRYLLSKKKTKTVTKEYLSYDSTDMYSGYRRDKHVETGSALSSNKEFAIPLHEKIFTDSWNQTVWDCTFS